MNESPLSLLKSHSFLTWAGLSLSVLLLFFSFGPIGHPFLAFFALLPAILLSQVKPAWKTWLRASFTLSWLLWIALLIWLRHVYPPLGYVGLIFLTAYCALYLFGWLAALRWIYPSINQAPLWARCLVILGLAGAWGLGEWIRGTILTGFGWLPFAASQETNPVVLSLCAWVGPYGLSSLIVLINLGFARWISRLIHFRNELHQVGPATPMTWFSRITPELYLGLAPLGISFILYANSFSESLLTLPPRTSFSSGIVQTDFDPNAKWDAHRLNNHLHQITLHTIEASKPDKNGQRPDFVLWPEAALPVSLENKVYLQILTQLAKTTQTTLIIGTIDKRGSGYANGVAVITSEGLQSPIYAKRHLVPFGEYVPFADYLPLRKVVPIQEDCVAGQDTAHFSLTTQRGEKIRAGALVCYEDVFPSLGREHALAGAQLMIVVTNDAWYGREAGAYQHNAHSVLLAAATGVPILRCGNAGWSGFIDSRGRMTALTQGEDPTIYFAGSGRVGPVSVKRENSPPTFWVQHGDYAIALGGLFFIFAAFWRRQQNSND